MKKMKAELLLLLLLSLLILTRQCGSVFAMLCVHAQALQSCPTLYHTMDCSLSGSSFHSVVKSRTRLKRLSMHTQHGEYRATLTGETEQR